MNAEHTFLFGHTGQWEFVLVLPCHFSVSPTVLHAAEEQPPGSRGQVGRLGGGICLDLNPTCTQKNSIRGDKIDYGNKIYSQFAWNPGWTTVFNNDLLAASTRRWRGFNSADDNCSFTLLMSLGWIKSNKLCPVSSNCEKKDTIDGFIYLFSLLQSTFSLTVFVHVPLSDLIWICIATTHIIVTYQLDDHQMPTCCVVCPVL